MKINMRTKVKKIIKTNDENINSTSFIDYLKNNSTYLIFIYIFTIALYGMWLAQYFVSFDAEGLYFSSNRIINNEWYYQWVALGRWAFVFLKKILGVQVINPFFSSSMFLILFPLSSFLWHYYLEKIGFKSKNIFGKIIFDIIYISHPIWALQFAYRNQIEVLSVISVLIPIVSYNFIFSIENIKNKNNWIKLLLSSIGLVFCFAGYQAFIFMYILFMFVYLFSRAINNNFNAKEFWKKTISIGLFSVLAFAIYIISTKIMCLIFDVHLGTSSYLGTQFAWLNSDLVHCFLHLSKYIVLSLFGDNVIFSCLFFVELVIAFVLFIINKKRINNKFQKFSVFIMLIMVIISPFILTIFTAATCVDRQQFSIILLFSILAYIEYNFIVDHYKIFNNKYALCFLIIFISCFVVAHIQMNTRLLYSDFYTMRQDYSVYNNIYNKALELGAKPGAAIYVHGQTDNFPNDSIVEREVIGFSYTEVNSIAPKKFVEAMIAEGFNVSFPTDEQVNKASEYVKKMKCYPDKDYIEVYENIIIVKFSD